MRHRLLLMLPAAMFLASCGDPDDGPLEPGGSDDGAVTFDAPWPQDLASVLDRIFSDGEGDQEQMPPEQAGPPYTAIVPFPPVDVTEIAIGAEGDFLYMRVEFAGAIPAATVHVIADGEIEEQWVGNQGMNIALNTDDDIETGGGGEGVSGIDIFFAVGFEYGMRNNVYANWSFPDGDLHHNEHHALGELGDGGPGTDFALVRYDISQLGSFLPRGATVDVGSWSEAESFDESGALLYHHFAFDRVIDGGSWPVPE